VDATSGRYGVRVPGKKRRKWPQSRANAPRYTRAPEGGDSEGSQPPLPVYGALDLGTNNCRLLLARPSSEGFTVIDAFSRIVRLGEGASRTGRLGDAAMKRTIEALRICANKLTWQHVKRRRLIATEACRMASNGREFIRRVKAETGLDLEIIDRETEAQLAVAGAAPLIDADARSVLIFDIGGGSTEIMWLGRDEGDFALREWASLPAGVVTLAERFGGITVSGETYGKMRDFVRDLLGPFKYKVLDSNSGSPRPDHMLGTSGTVTTIAGVQMQLRRYDRSRVDGTWLKAEDIVGVTSRLLAMSYEERAASPCIGRDRADLVLAGCAILEEICAAFPADRLRVADRGLREGILTHLMREDGTYGAAHGTARPQ
jgi:exopolyphosphatase/guanosine-5'-triphosphate,3'-diphosphate pyrophosphatase